LALSVITGLTLGLNAMNCKKLVHCFLNNLDSWLICCGRIQYGYFTDWYFYYIIYHMPISGENITSVLLDWLQQEVKDSDEGRNASLSEFEARKPDFDKPFNDTDNMNTGKLAGHYDRLRAWAPQYLELAQEHDDYATARLVFCSLMFISGNYRTQCMLEATSGEEYRRLRHNKNPVGIDLLSVTETELINKSTLNPDPSARLNGLVERTIDVNESNLTNAIANLSLEPDQPPVPEPTRIESVRCLQEKWAGLAIAQIMVAAGFRDGDFSLVPFFEPKSITDQKHLQYPLV
jgi:hypothetical protein